MVNITHKTNSLRQAVASATVIVSKPETMEAIKKRAVPKGDVLEFSRAAGLLAIKKTSDVIPDCHPLPVEYAAIEYNFDELKIIITVEVHTIYKTGVEVEAMHGAMITALTMYDMLKPIDKGIEITTVKLLNKKGGKTDFNTEDTTGIRCVIIICSDTVAAGTNKDATGVAIAEKIKKFQLSATVEIIPDNMEMIQAKVKQHSIDGIQLLLFAGGTGLSAKDITPEAIEPMLDRKIPGIMEAARAYGQERMPYSMLSRGIAGFIKNTLVITLPGSPRGAAETVDALFPYVLHVFRVAGGIRHSG